MSYSLRFSDKAQKAWDKLDSTIREQLTKVLARRLDEPRVLSPRLRGGQEFYKIKLRDAGYRLIYEVNDTEIVVYVIAVSQRKEVYVALERMLGNRTFD